MTYNVKNYKKNNIKMKLKNSFIAKNIKINLCFESMKY